MGGTRLDSSRQDDPRRAEGFRMNGSQPFSGEEGRTGLIHDLGKAGVRKQTPGVDQRKPPCRPHIGRLILGDEL